MEEKTNEMFDLACKFTMTGQRCDVITRSGRAILDAKFGGKFYHALSYGGGVKAVTPLLNKMELDTPKGEEFVALKDIWALLPMPNEGFKKADIDAVDLKQADELAGDSGKTVKEIIKEYYNPKTDKELDYYLRRFLAS
jgi:hypothetical protein